MDNMKNTDIDLTIVIPVCNEEEVLPEAYSRLTNVIRSTDLSYELIFVDDGSSDNTYKILSQFAEGNPSLKVLSFSRNFGHQAALAAGLDHAAGKAVIIMDGDLQHPPELIPALIKKWQEGYEVVNTIREYDKNERIVKKYSSGIFYKAINILAHIKIPAGTADFKLLDRQVVNTLKGLKEKNRFLRGLTVWIGFRQAGIRYVASQRFAGQTKYSLKKMLQFAANGITSFSTFPLRIAIYTGFAISFCSFAYVLYALYISLIANRAIPGWASTVIPVFFLGGIQLITIGILGEYIGHIYDEVKNRPVYIIKEKIGFSGGDTDRNGQ